MGIDRSMSKEAIYRLIGDLFGVINSKGMKSLEPHVCLCQAVYNNAFK